MIPKPDGGTRRLGIPTVVDRLSQRASQQVLGPIYEPPFADEIYVYDANGNRTNNGYTVGANNRLTSDGTYAYLYDAEGNRVARFIDADEDGQISSGDTDITVVTGTTLAGLLITAVTFVTQTGLDFSSSDEVLAATGADALLDKPVSPKVFIDAIERLTGVENAPPGA